MRILLLFLLPLAVACAAAQNETATLTLSTAPDPLGLGQNRFDVTVRDASGNPVTDATVALSLVMPADPSTKHPEMRTEGALNNAGEGRYSGVAMVTMAGTWDVTVTATRDGRTIGQTKTSMVAHARQPELAAMPAAAPEQESAAAAEDKPEPRRHEDTKLQPRRHEDTKRAAAAQHGGHTHTHPKAAALKNPVRATPESMASGAALFGKQCASCHGTSGQGDGPMAAKIKSPPADLTDAEWKHGPSDGEIFTLIRDGAVSAGMKAYGGVLSDQEIWHLVNYIRSLGPR